MATKISVEQWLKLPEQDLPVKLGEVLTPGPWEHIWVKADDDRKQCRKCGHDVDYDQLLPSCPVPDPITIDGNTATEWRDRMLADYHDEFVEAMWQILLSMLDDTCTNSTQWLMEYAEPKHYLIAAAMAAEGEQE